MSIEVGQVYILEGTLNIVHYSVITKVSGASVWSCPSKADGTPCGAEERMLQSKIFRLGTLLTDEMRQAAKAKNAALLARRKATDTANEIALQISRNGLGQNADKVATMLAELKALLIY